MNGNVSGLVRCVLRGNAQLQETIFQVLRLVGRVLQIQTLVAQMPQVLVLGVVGLTVDTQGNVVCLGVIDLFVTALDVPLTPRGDDGHFGGQRFQGQLKTNLVVALAGAAVANSVCALFFCYIGKTLCDTGTSVRCAEKILFMPDALSWMLTGEAVCEYTIASTSQMLNPVTKELDEMLLESLELPRGKFGKMVVPRLQDRRAHLMRCRR